MGNYKRFMDDIGKEIGYGIKKNDHHITPMSKAIVVLRKINNELKIVTSYPIDFDVSKAKDMDDQYEEFSCLLLYFLHDSYEKPEISEIQTIQRYVLEEDSHNIKRALEEGAVVLKLEPFPHEWIINTINREVDSGWAHEIIEMLEQEAKKAGKI
jgi:hypothetical protein